MDTETQEQNINTKEVVREFVVKKMVLLLAESDCERKIKEDMQFLIKLDIPLEPGDIAPFISAISGSALIDNENNSIKDGSSIKRYFSILGDLFGQTDMFAYYNKFSKVKLDRPVFSDHSYVSTALEIIDQANWEGDSPNEQTRVKVRDYLLGTILSAGLCGLDKIYNLNMLQEELMIELSEEEKAQISNHLKQDIMKSVDLIDQMRKTAFGAKPLPAGTAYERRPIPEELSPVEEDSTESVEKKKGLFGKLFG